MIPREVERSRRPGAVRLWNLLDHSEREAAARWFVESVEGGRRQIDEAVAGRLAVAFLLGRGSERNRGRGQRRRGPATGVNPASLCVARQSG